jgi:acetyl-CoA carboxylase biotin carboxyl carrier protein
VPRPRKSPPRKSAKAVKRRPAIADNPGGAMPGLVPLGQIRQLIRLVQRTGIGELEVTAGGRTVRISATSGVPLQMAMPSSAASLPASPGQPASSSAEAKSSEAAKSDKLVAITSPMVGTFYRAPAPDADPYVEVGDMVEVGQTICIVEAMKLMNEIESEVRGRVVQILTDNSHPVEFGQKLFMIEPA